MKIKLMVVTPYFYPKIGGMENHVLEIIRGLERDYNYEIVVVTSKHNDKLRDVESVNGIRIYRLPIQFKISNTPFSFRWKSEISNIIDIEKPDIINGRGPVPFISDVAARIAKKKRIPFVLGWHFPSMKKGSFLVDLLIDLYEKTILKNTLRISKRIICSSNYVKETLLRDFKDKTTVITQGINQKVFDTSRKYNKKEFSVLFVGNFETKVKGLSFLIEAISKVKRKHPKVELKVVGPGDIRSYKEACKKFNILDNVSFLGKLEKEDIVKHYKESEIFICPSTSENLPSTIIEAMYCKTAVISTNIGDIPNLIKSGKNGILIKPFSSEEISKACLNLFEYRKLRKKLEINGYNSVIGKFDWDDRIRLTNKIFMDLI